MCRYSYLLHFVSLLRCWHSSTIYNLLGTQRYSKTIKCSMPNNTNSNRAFFEHCEVTLPVAHKNVLTACQSKVVKINFKLNAALNSFTGVLHLFIRRAGLVHKKKTNIILYIIGVYFVKCFVLERQIAQVNCHFI